MRMSSCIWIRGDDALAAQSLRVAASRGPDLGRGQRVPLRKASASRLHEVLIFGGVNASARKASASRLHEWVCHMVLGYHVIIGAYGFWLPNDPRKSWSDFVGSWDLFRFGKATTTTETRSLAGRRMIGPCECRPKRR